MRREDATTGPAGGTPASLGPTAAAGGRWRRRFVVVLKIAVSAALLWLLFATYDFAGAVRRLAGIDPLMLALAVLAEMIAIAVITWRWLLILDGLGVAIGARPAAALVYIGLFFNQTLPSNVGGDVVRIWRIFKHGAALGRAVGSVMLDRVVALVALALVVLAALPFATSLIGRGPAWLALWGLVAAVLAGLAVLLGLDRLMLPLARVLPGRLRAALAALSRDARLVLLYRRTGAVVVLVSMANHVISVLLVFTLARGLGIEARFLDFLVLVPPVILVSLLPISLAGWGVREGAMVAALGFAGIPPASALALSVAYGLLLLVCSLPGGVIWFVTGNRAGAVPTPAAPGD